MSKQLIVSQAFHVKHIITTLMYIITVTFNSFREENSVSDTGSCQCDIFRFLLDLSSSCITLLIVSSIFIYVHFMSVLTSTLPFWLLFTTNLATLCPLYVHMLLIQLLSIFNLAAFVHTRLKYHNLATFYLESAYISSTLDLEIII